MAVEVHSSFVIHPGTWLKEAVVAPTGLSVRALAEKLDVSRPTLSRLLNGHAGLSSEMALRFEKAFGLSQLRLCATRRRRANSRCSANPRKLVRTGKPFRSGLLTAPVRRWSQAATSEPVSSPSTRPKTEPAPSPPRLRGCRQERQKLACS